MAVPPTINRIEVILEKTIFTGNDVVRGYISLNLAKKIKSRKICIVVKGQEQTVWKVQEGKSTRTVYNTHPILELQGTVHSNANSSIPEVLLPGSYRFPFAIQLPPTILSSHMHSPKTTFRAKWSKRSYEVVGYVDIPLWFDMKHSIAIIMKRKMPPLLPETALALMQPLVSVGKKEFWFGNGEMSITVTSKALYTPGEEMLVSVFLNNTSQKPVEKTVVSIMRCEQWKYPESSITEIEKSTEDSILSEVVTEKVLPGTTASYQFTFRLPEEESICTIEFGAANNLTLQQSIIIDVRLEFSLAMDGRLSIPIQVVLPDEIPYEVQQQYLVTQPTLSSSMTATASFAAANCPPVPAFYEAGPPPAYPFEICISVPAGFTSVSYKGRTLFLDHLYRRTVWHWERTYHKEIGLACGQTPPYPSPQSQSLPPGWEISCDAAGRTYLLDHNLRRTFWSLPGVLNFCIQELSVNERALPDNVRCVIVATVGSTLVGQLELPRDGTGLGLLPTWQVPLAGLPMPLLLSIQSLSPITGEPRLLASTEIVLVDLDGRTGETKVVNAQLDSIQHKGARVSNTSTSTESGVFYPTPGAVTPGGPTPGGRDELDDWVDIAAEHYVKLVVALSYTNNLLSS